MSSSTSATFSRTLRVTALMVATATLLSAQSGDLRLKLVTGKPARVEGKVEANSRYVTGTCGARKVWAPTDAKGRFSMPIVVARGPKGPEEVIIADTRVPIKLSNLSPQQIQASLDRLSSMSPKREGLATAQLGSRLYNTGHPALAVTLFTRAFALRDAQGTLDGEAWLQWWSYAHEYVLAMTLLGQSTQGGRDLLVIANKVPKSVGQNFLIGMADQTLGLAELMLAQGEPHEGDRAGAKAVVQAAAVLRQRAGRLPRRVSPIWFSEQ